MADVPLVEITQGPDGNSGAADEGEGSGGSGWTQNLPLWLEDLIRKMPNAPGVRPAREVAGQVRFLGHALLLADEVLGCKECLKEINAPNSVYNRRADKPEGVWGRPTGSQNIKALEDLLGRHKPHHPAGSANPVERHASRASRDAMLAAVPLFLALRSSLPLPVSTLLTGAVGGVGSAIAQRAILRRGNGSTTTQARDLPTTAGQSGGGGSSVSGGMSRTVSERWFRANWKCRKGESPDSCNQRLLAALDALKVSGRLIA
jgi:hypothetical protein